ncbi:hypothetical protein GIB67_042638 [Kingdonia uniflora]|uniref:Uncharacterized protein n=1 Tax=Kingdonia uniflora TaxID=39325 RepID=A0A7J7M1B6_9MAGN|nr:hypothetical protein GIB67_042638 [Kingdonia uniflora]
MLDVVPTILFPKKLYLTLSLLFPCIFFLPSGRTSPQEYSGASTSIESSRIAIFGVPDVGVSGSVLVELPGQSLKFDFLATLRAGWPM